MGKLFHNAAPNMRKGQQGLGHEKQIYFRLTLPGREGGYEKEIVADMPQYCAKKYKQSLPNLSKFQELWRDFVNFCFRQTFEESLPIFPSSIVDIYMLYFNLI